MRDLFQINNKKYTNVLFGEEWRQIVFLQDFPTVGIGTKRKPKMLLKLVNRFQIVTRYKVNAEANQILKFQQLSQKSKLKHNILINIFKIT